MPRKKNNRSSSIVSLKQPYIGKATGHPIFMGGAPGAGNVGPDPTLNPNSDTPPWYVEGQEKPPLTKEQIRKKLLVQWHVEAWATRLDKIMKKRGWKEPETDIATTPLGSFFLRWKINGRSLEVLIGEKTAWFSVTETDSKGVEQLACMGENPYDMTTQGDIDDPEDIERVFGWLFRDNEHDNGSPTELRELSLD